MKKQIKWLVAALALSALATPAFAVNADMTGTLSVRAIATDNMDGNDDTKDKNQFVDQRFRLFTTVAANENVKAVFGIETDNVWGRETAGTGKEIGTIGADAKSQIEIKNLYLDFKIPALGASVKAGTQPVNIGRGLIINDDAAALTASLPCKIVPANTINLYWVKPAEGKADITKDEADFYGAKYTVKAGDLSIAPYVGYYKSWEDAPIANTKDVHAGFVGIDVDGKAGDLTYALTGIYESFSRNDGTGLALLAKGAYALSPATTVSLEVASYGSEDNGGEFLAIKDANASGPSNNFSEIITGGMYTTNSTPAVNVGGAAATYSANYTYAKLGAVQKLSDSLKASAYLMHVQQAADTAGGDAGTYGQEVDAYLDYTVVPGLTLNLAGAYLLADDDFGDDAWKLASSLNYKF